MLDDDLIGAGLLNLLVVLFDLDLDLAEILIGICRLFGIRAPDGTQHFGWAVDLHDVVVELVPAMPRQYVGKIYFLPIHSIPLSVAFLLVQDYQISIPPSTILIGTDQTRPLSFSPPPSIATLFFINEPERHPMFFFCSDPHGDFSGIIDYAVSHRLGWEDVGIVLGDACLNYYLDERDDKAKRELATSVPCRLLFIRGNHDSRPASIAGYVPVPAFSGHVLVEPRYPNLLFAQDVACYNFDGYRSVVLAGAAMAEPGLHMLSGLPVPKNPQLTEWERDRAEDMMCRLSWETDLVLSHTCPESFILPEMQHPLYDQSKLDHSFERWLDNVAGQLDYGMWLFGHFHKDADIESKRAMCLMKRIVALEDLDF